MKKIIPFFLLLVLSASSFSQQTNPAPALTKQDYLQKSKKQKTAAWIMLGGGASLMIIGIASVSAEDAGNYIFGGDQSGFNTGMVIFYAGVISAGGSIPLFLASGRNKRKGMSLSFKSETAPQIQKNSFVYRPVPSLSIKIGL